MYSLKVPLWVLVESTSWSEVPVGSVFTRRKANCRVQISVSAAFLRTVVAFFLVNRERIELTRLSDFPQAITI
jgi:hypothetical protein